MNTSGNDVIHRFINSIYEPQKLTKLELEHLVNGGSVQKEISQEMTYKELEAGNLSYKSDWIVRSNRESGTDSVILRSGSQILAQELLLK